MSDEAPVVIVAGPTASGKSALALALAEAFAGTIINADSMQVYRGLRILTARPDAAALARAPHRLYGVLPAREACSAGRWRAMALKEIARAHAAGRLPIVVGGTGLYLKALEEGLSPVPPVPAAVRRAARRHHAELGGAAFHAALAARDPAMAARLHPNDTQRLIRAWEVLEATGRSLAAWQRGGAAGALPYRRLRLVLEPPRAALYAACDARFAAMMAAGALGEARRLLGRGLDPALPIMRAVGLAALARHLAGELTLEAAVAGAQQATRRYAKRQLTWLRTQMLGPDAPAPEADSPAGGGETGSEVRRVAGDTWLIGAQYSESLKLRIFKIVREFLLTPSV